MEQKLQILYNTLMTIETKGESTKTMAECLKFIEQTINEERNKPMEQVEKVEAEVVQ